MEDACLAVSNSVAEDDEIIRTLTTQILTKAGFVVDSAIDGEKAWDQLHRQAYDLLITDNEMPYLKGIELIERIRRSGVSLSIIVCSAAFTADRADLDRLRIAAILPKPLGFRQLLETVRRVLESVAPISGPRE